MYSICAGNKAITDKLNREFKKDILVQTSELSEMVGVPLKRGRKPLNRGKMMIAGPKGKVSTFWDRRNSMEEAIDDSFLPDAQPGGNYDKAKKFLQNEWSGVEEFKLPDLAKALGEKYPEQSDYNGFRLQRWHDAAYWESGEIAIKPIYKKASYRTYFNIFYVEPECYK